MFFYFLFRPPFPPNIFLPSRWCGHDVTTSPNTRCFASSLLSLPQPTPYSTQKEIHKASVYFLPANLTRRFPMCQIGAFRSLKSDCTRLRHRRMSWMVSKGRTSVWLLKFEAGSSVKSHVLSQLNKIKGPNFTNFTISWIWERIERDWEVKES